jgi:hypothetical protein
MEVRPIERVADAFQQSVTPDQIEAMCRRVFGSSVHVASAVELGNGMYNNTYRVGMEPGAAEPTISGVFDNDRTSWGDPESDWTIFMAAKKPGTERDAFWETYGPRPSTTGAARRSLFYLAKHNGAIRLERHRLGNADTVPETYEQMRDVLDQLQV